MRTKAEAVKTLLAAGWTELEINTILQHSPPTKIHNRSNGDSPWWKHLSEDEVYFNGNPIVDEWVVWLESISQ